MPTSESDLFVGSCIESSHVNHIVFAELERNLACSEFLSTAERNLSVSHWMSVPSPKVPDRAFQMHYLACQNIFALVCAFCFVE